MPFKTHRYREFADWESYRKWLAYVNIHHIKHDTNTFVVINGKLHKMGVNEK